MSLPSPHPDNAAAVMAPVVAPVRVTGTQRWARRAVAVLLVGSALLSLGYAAASIYITTRLVYAPPSPIAKTSAALGLRYRDVTFPSAVDGVRLRGWLIPGVLPDGQLTVERTIVMVHGTRTNRTDLPAGALYLSGELARHGFAVLAFDMRGMGESPPAPLSFGYFEQRDVLGAVDFLRTGTLPYPELGRPRAIGGWGVSMGGSTLLLAAAHTTAIQAIVTDSAYADAVPLIERQLPEQGGVPGFFTPGVLQAARALYGIDVYAVRPVDVMARLAPRPLLLIQGSDDHIVSPSNLDVLYAAARAAPNAHVERWLVPGADHAQSYHTAGEAYVNRVLEFYTAALGAATGVSR